MQSDSRKNFRLWLSPARAIPEALIRDRKGSLTGPIGPIMKNPGEDQFPGQRSFGWFKSCFETHVRLNCEKLGGNRNVPAVPGRPVTARGAPNSAHLHLSTNPLAARAFCRDGDRSLADFGIGTARKWSRPAIGLESRSKELFSRFRQPPATDASNVSCTGVWTYRRFSKAATARYGIERLVTDDIRDPTNQPLRINRAPGRRFSGGLVP